MFCVCLSTDENAIEAEVKKRKEEKSSLLLLPSLPLSLTFAFHIKKRRRRGEEEKRRRESEVVFC